MLTSGCMEPGCDEIIVEWIYQRTSNGRAQSKFARPQYGGTARSRRCAVCAEKLWRRMRMERKAMLAACRGIWGSA